MGFDKAVGGPSERKAHNATSEALNSQICELYRGKYAGFNIKHFLEKLREEEQLPRVPCYVTVLTLLRKQRLIPEQLKRGRKHRLKRERKPQPGMMLFMDGSTHGWWGISHQRCDLVVVMDDATSEIYYASFVKEENTTTCLKGLLETVRSQGVPVSLYVDRATHFFKTRKKGEKVDVTVETQVKRALSKIGCTLMPSYSPQARGRMERLWSTLQGRWPQELKLHGVKTIEEANAVVGKLVKQYNTKFTVKPMNPQSVFQRLANGIDLDLVFSLQTQRVVHNDNTVMFKNVDIQIPPHPHFPHGLAGSKVVVHELWSGEIAVTYGDKVVARLPELSVGLKLGSALPILSLEQEDAA